MIGGLVSDCRWNYLTMVPQEDFACVRLFGKGAGLVIYMGQKRQVHAVWKWSLWHLDLHTAKSCCLPPHTQMQKHTQHLLLCPLCSTPLFFSEEFKSKMNLSVTELLQLQEKHTFQHMESGGEGRVERAGAAGTARGGGEQGAKEEQLFRSLRGFSDLMCAHAKRGLCVWAEL